MRMLILATAAAIVLPVAAQADSHMAAADQAAATDCGEKIDRVADAIPRAGDDPAPRMLGLEEEQHEALLATLDAARLADAAGDADVCMTLAEAAEAYVAKGEQQARGEDAASPTKAPD